jgi:hypothetical protein
MLFFNRKNYLDTFTMTISEFLYTAINNLIDI